MKPKSYVKKHQISCVTVSFIEKESFNLRFQQATGQLENTARMRTVKRDTARVLTILNQQADSRNRS